VSVPQARYPEDPVCKFKREVERGGVNRRAYRAITSLSSISDAPTRPATTESVRQKV
jgi:hypothetical protein